MHKKVLIVIIIVVVAGGLIWLANSSQDKLSTEDPQTADLSDQLPTPNEEDINLELPPAAEPPVPQTPAPTPPKNNETGGTFSGEGDLTAPDISVFEVVYDGSAFSPASLTIKAGDIVFFKNNGSDSFRPASDPHPSHTDYPGFDSGSAVAAGKRFEFKFNNAGTWEYHDHLNPSAKGTIIVTK